VSGAAVAVVKGDKVLLKGHGYRDLEKRLPVTPNTLFAIGPQSDPWGDPPRSPKISS